MCRAGRQRGQRPRTSAFAVYTAIATAFSSRLISFLEPCPLWCHRQNVLQVFPCGCKFSNLHFPDKIKSCRHKRHRHLVLSWFRSGGNNLIGRRRGIQRQGETDRQKSPWRENAARHRNRTVSSDGEPNPSRKYPTDSAEAAFSEGSFSQWEKGHQNCKSRAESEANILRSVLRMTNHAVRPQAQSMP
jgi:hypothetical protein